MGVEWNLGCLKCKKQIWLGSQKPFSWKGFQIGDENVKRFLLIHSLCNNKANGNLLLTNDETTKIPWEDDSKKLEWKEDILSRTFCFDSYSQEGLKCANCSKSIEVDNESKMLNGKLMKSQYLWFCNDSCLDNYIEFNRTQRQNFIYDSTNDIPINLKEYSIEVSCTNCKVFVSIDNNKDSCNRAINFEYLALFLCEHVGHDHSLKVHIDGNDNFGKQTKLHNDWKEYEY